MCLSQQYNKVYYAYRISAIYSYKESQRGTVVHVRHQHTGQDLLAISNKLNINNKPEVAT
jgi:hypothetical protein